MNAKANAVDVIQASQLMSAVVLDAFKTGKTPQNIALMGAPGLGKSAITWQLADTLEQELGEPVNVVDVRLSGMEAADVQGIPFVVGGESKETAEMAFSTPTWFPEGDGYTILFLDELTNCAPQVQHAAYRIILDRSIQNGKTMSNKVAIIAAGNRKEDKTGAKPLLPAAANRFGLHLEIDSQSAGESFIKYAMDKGIDRTIVGYLSYRSEHVYRTPENGESAFPTPRSWEFADAHVKNEGIASNTHLLNIAMAGAVGAATAQDYMGFREYYKDLPNWKKVRSGEQDYEMPKNDEGVKYAVSSSLAFELIDCLNIGNDDKEEATRQIDNLCKVFEQAPSELKVVTFKTLKSAEKWQRAFQYKNLMNQFKPIATRLGW